ncbi:Dot/Icm T4SS effector alpha/beta hydrolase [Legionella sp. km772]|uniref:Dot/Icm T4SS effector alpha/beta hydrolase n=1 Tax=Legionella sp. km772 TaxID=2498111 RepID=UPI001F3C696B|nr:Dot/Icm T4SS effector alpha/beta hydrolase [Legionella sp. km772]
MTAKKKEITKDSFLHRRLQDFVANLLFPVGKGDWYKEKKYGDKKSEDIFNPFNDFVSKQREPKGHYYKAFKDLDLSLSTVDTTLTTTEPCKLEVFKCAPKADAPKKPGTGKHIVYFPGANTYYQACFRDISAAAKETGATVHAFNFPGTGLSSGKVREANDLINSGMAVVANLIKEGVHPDDIILQGDCYGAAIALEVKKQLAEQASINVRLVMNNAFKSFKAAVCDMITESKWLPAALKGIVKRLLEFTGWHITPGKQYKFADPYQCHIQHLGDHTLESASLSGKVAKYQDESRTGVTKSEKRAPMQDTCPEEYRKDRDFLDSQHYVRVDEAAKKRLGDKFGRDKYGRVNAHFADLCELKMLDGRTVYEGYVNEFISRSDKYIANHPQKSIEEIQDDLLALRYLEPAAGVTITEEEADEFDTVMQVIKDNQYEYNPSYSDEDVPSDTEEFSAKLGGYSAP